TARIGDQHSDTCGALRIGEDGVHIGFKLFGWAADAPRHPAQPAYPPPLPVTGVADLAAQLPWYHDDYVLHYDDTVEANRHDNTLRAGAAGAPPVAVARPTRPRRPGACRGGPGPVPP